MSRRIPVLAVFMVILCIGAQVHTLGAQPSQVHFRLTSGVIPFTHIENTNPADPAIPVTFTSEVTVDIGIQIYSIINSWLEVGLGASWNPPRKLVFQGRTGAETFGFIPIYVSTRFRAFTNNVADFFVTVNLGFSFLQTTPEFRAAMNTGGNPFVEMEGGFHLSTDLGLSFHLVERTKWAFDLSLSGGYIFQMASGVIGTERSSILMHGVRASIGLDWFI